MTPSVREDRPPFVQFETRAIENGSADGAASFRDVDFVIITPQGSKDKIEKVATEWLDQCRSQVKEARLPQTWFNHYKAIYDAFKEGKEAPVNGKPLITWTPASPGQIKTLLTYGLRSVEDLANANEEVIARLGMGGRQLRQLAINWLAEAKEIGVSAVQITELQAQNAVLKEQVERLSTQVQALARSTATEAPPRSSREIAAADLME